MLKFQLFRIKVYSSGQMTFNGRKKPSEILEETINSLPPPEQGRVWHLGNVCKVDESGLYFRVGRTTKAKREIYQDGNFLDEEFEEAPYTHVVLDIQFELCAIAEKTKLSTTTTGIANKLIRLFNESEAARHFSAKFEIDRISNPKDLITHLRQAYVISQFWMTFTRPNPFDVEEHFTKPFQRFVKETQGEKGKAEVKGENLKAEILEELARSAAATGNDAAAHLRIDEKREPTTIHLRDNPVIIQQDDVSDDDQKKTLLNKVRQIYRKVRGESGND